MAKLRSWKPQEGDRVWYDGFKCKVMADASRNIVKIRDQFGYVKDVPRDEVTPVENGD